MAQRANSGAGLQFLSGMMADPREADVREVLKEHDARYEVHPYYVVLDQRPAGAPPVEHRVRAGFEVDLYGTLENRQLPIHDTKAQMVVNYFEAIARDIQTKVGQDCTVDIIASPESVVLDVHDSFRPLALLRIQISHARGLEQPEGPAEEQALKSMQETLRRLDVKQT